LEHRRVLVDTSIFIEYFRKENKKNTKLYWLREEGYEIVTSSICYFEYMSGSKNGEFDTVLFKNIAVIDFDKEQAYIASQTFKDLKQRNVLIEFRDILISSSAMALDIPLATLNRRHFERIEDLILLEI
jgi:predicted nucleic acid-binding protein